MSKIIDFKSRKEFEEVKNQKMLDWEKTNQANILNEFHDAEIVIEESNLVYFNKKEIQ